MTEKRFVGSSGGVYDRYKQDRFVWSEWEEIIRIMNNLNEKARERSKALSKLQKENEQLQETIEFIFKQIKAFREDCRTYQYFDGASTITELIRILEREKE